MIITGNVPNKNNPCKSHRKKFSFGKRTFFRLKLEIFSRVLIIKPVSIDETLTSSGSTQTELLLDGFGNINDRVRHLILTGF